MAGFEYRGQLNGADNPVTLDCPIKNSATVKVGDLVYNDGNGITRATNSTLVLGVVVGIVNNDGIDLDNASVDTYDGTWTSSSKTYVAGDDNMTDKKVRAKVIADENALWYNDADGDFTNPGDLHMFIKCADQDQIDEDTTSATVGQFFVVKLDPDGDADASKCIVKIARSQLNAYEPET
jgi:hypothetical protein